MEALGAQPAAAAVKEVKWAKGLTLNSRGDLWNMAFQIRGKRHAFSLRCSQAEAAVAFDLGCYWAHAAKGNNPEGSTRYNFGVAWFPRTLLAELLALPDWTAVKASLTHMLSLGMLRQLVPFEGAARRYSVAPADGGRSQSGLEMCVNARGVHFFRCSGWTCVPADDVHSFGSRGPLVQLTYTPPPTGGPGRPKPATTVVLSCDTAAAAAELYSQLQEAAALRTEAGLPAAQDLGAAFALPLGGNLLGSSVQARPGRAGVAAAARADLLLSQEEGQAGEDDSPACSTQDSAAAAAAELDDDPSLEELALFTEFAELARSASGCGTHGSGCGATTEGAAGSCPALDVKREPAAEGAATVKPELEKVEAQPESPLGVAPKSPAARPEADLAAASSRSSMDGGCSSVGLDAAVQRQGSEAGSSEAQQQGALSPPRHQEPADEGPACKKQRLEQASPAPGCQQPQQVQPAAVPAWVPPQHGMQHTAQQVPLAAMPVAALPPAMLHHMAVLQQQAAAAHMAAAAAAGSAATSPTAGGMPAAAAGAHVPMPMPCFAMPPVAGMVPVMLPPAVAVAMQRQLACAVPTMVPAAAAPWASKPAAPPAQGTAEHK